MLPIEPPIPDLVSVMFNITTYLGIQFSGMVRELY